MYYFHSATPFIENTKLRAYMYTMEAFPSRHAPSLNLHILWYVPRLALVAVLIVINCIL